jgi:hypothetical protein
MMQDAPDDHNDYTLAFCIDKSIAVSQRNNNLISGSRAYEQGLPLA